MTMLTAAHLAPLLEAARKNVPHVADFRAMKYTEFREAFIDELWSNLRDATAVCRPTSQDDPAVLAALAASLFVCAEAHLPRKFDPDAFQSWRVGRHLAGVLVNEHIRLTTHEHASTNNTAYALYSWLLRNVQPAQVEAAVALIKLIASEGTDGQV